MYLAQVSDLILNMNLPIYQHINIRSQSFEDLGQILNTEMNFKHPVVFNIKALDQDQQREFIGLIENYFTTKNVSFLFPYPMYIVTDHDPSISEMPVIGTVEELPQFYNQKEGKMNVKETHLLSKNKLQQQEIRNADPSVTNESLEHYGHIHRKIYKLDQERQFYRHLLDKLTKKRS